MHSRSLPEKHDDRRVRTRQIRAGLFCASIRLSGFNVGHRMWPCTLTTMLATTCLCAFAFNTTWPYQSRNLENHFSWQLRSGLDTISRARRACPWLLHRDSILFCHCLSQRAPEPSAQSSTTQQMMHAECLCPNTPQHSESTSFEKLQNPNQPIPHKHLKYGSLPYFTLHTSISSHHSFATAPHDVAYNSLPTVRSNE